ncbi:hypothetical protein [Planococcus donghaensis]|uniref:Uncharacterized protein n=1 Tax=Planococcus donghaensis TaxID=414778 RepID=A0A1C7EF27_9BACL|nr:hypothetical protein [Planococcus donghaensis]ANU21997.1 hypothetical protein BCM40_00990 [Planococcus donghaensis]
MLEIKEKWYTGWERDFSKEYLKTLKTEALIESLEFFDTFMERSEIDSVYEVLNALPGHGKTTALKIFIKKNLENRSSVSGLIVLREKKQIKELASFAEGYPNGVLYVDSENYHQVKAFISDYQFVIITHERLKNLILNEGTTNHLSAFKVWKDRKRVLIIDEAPVFVDSTTFELGKGLEWLDDCFKAGGHIFTSEQQIMIRSLIQILLAREFLQNKEVKTKALISHLDSEIYREVLIKFFEIVENHMEKMSKAESIGIFQWFKKLVYVDATGYIDTGFYSESYSDHKKIICSRRIDYRKSGCSILILDGTASHTREIYNKEYRLHSSVNHTKYERLTIHQQRINTSARKRRIMRGFSTQKLIASDIQKIQQNLGIVPFPIMSKFEIKEYVKLNVISKENFETYFQISDSDDSTLPINLLNTVGKNYLSDQNSLYLTSLPNRTASYYKAMAISLYENAVLPLDFSMEVKDKKNKNAWFADERIEKIYEESLRAELFQIISRSNIRNLSVSSDETVHIFIATNFDHLIEGMMKMFDGKVSLIQTDVEKDSKFEARLDEKVKEAAEKIINENIKLPAAVGKVTNGSALKNLLNQHWHDPKKRKIITAVFRRNELDIIEKSVQGGKVNKEVIYFSKS